MEILKSVRMRKSMRFLLFLGLLSGFSGVKAQSIAHYFTQMPANLIPAVSVDTRKDLVDFFKNSKSAVMPSLLGGQVILKELSDDYLMLETSENADLQLKMLQVNDTLRVIALIHSVAAPLKDSRINFYTTLWQPFNGIALPPITFMDFMDVEKGKALGLADRFNQVCMRNFVFYKFKPNIPEVVVHSSIRADLRPELLNDFGPIIKDSITCVFDKDHFNLQH